MVCRERADPDDLTRLSPAPDGTVVVDFRGKLPGRGAWVHPGCLARLEEKPGPLSRAFKRAVPSSDWVAQYRTALRSALRDGLSMAAASGALAGGHVVLKAAIEAGEITEVAFASDCAERTERSIREAAGEGATTTRLPFTASEIGRIVGRGPRAAIGVRRSRAAIHLIRQLRRLRSLG